MVRPACCEKLHLKRGLWTEEEDAKILAHGSKHGNSNWTAFPKKAGLTRCGKSCRLRWTNYLRPNLKHESFTPHEEELIVRLHATIGSRWPIIAQQLPGRTDKDVKNYWNTKLKKKLSEMGIDHVTHKPFSQILADYGNIGGLPKAGMRMAIGSLNKDLKNAILMKPELPYSLSTHGFSSINSHLMPMTMIPIKREPIQDGFLSNAQSSNQPFDLLTQLQAIRLVTEASNSTNLESSPPNLYIPEGTLSSSPSSSTCSSAAQEQATLQAFSWSDFLLEDAFFPTCDAQEHEDKAEYSSMDMLNQSKAAIPQSQIEDQAGMQKYNEVEATSPCDSSFVEAMVARENEMFLEFPQLMEEPFYY
ncbi:unnamed protein product [Prunus armeniaca]|uniref:Uncharacterized protein n=1 Tax=Prunus armeniaca TaxID=36596 RepID=A0A6J5UZP8_PRUAR|nr:unnamed protein product [Prunus armeniaca]